MIVFLSPLKLHTKYEAKDRLRELRSNSSGIDLGLVFNQTTNQMLVSKNCVFVNYSLIFLFKNSLNLGQLDIADRMNFQRK